MTFLSWLVRRWPLASDPQAARSEWLGEWRTDIAQFLDDASIDAAVDHGRPLELPPREGVIYFCFVDMSGGRHDASVICICHRDEGGARTVVDVIRGKRGPHDPQAAALEFAALAGEYRCHTIVGDAYAGEWTAAAYRGAGREWRKSRHVRSDLYLEGAPLFSRGLISIPPEPAILLRELRLLERRTARSGRDSVDHGTGGSDDFANALFGAMHLAADKASDEVNTAIWGAPGWGILSGGPRQYFGDAGVGTAASVGLAAAAARGIPPG